MYKRQLEELCQAFSLERVHKAGSRFDPEKAKWFNHKYLIHKPDTELAIPLKEILESNGIQADLSQIEKVCGLMKERANFVKDIYNDSLFFFVTPEEYNEKDVKKYWKEESIPLMQELYNLLSKIEDYSFANTEKIISAWINTKEIGFGKVMNPFRVAIVGAAKGQMCIRDRPRRDRTHRRPTLCPPYAIRQSDLGRRSSVLRS